MPNGARCDARCTALREISEKRKVKSAKWSLREVKSEELKVKSGPFGK